MSGGHFRISVEITGDDDLINADQILNSLPDRMVVSSYHWDRPVYDVTSFGDFSQRFISTGELNIVIEGTISPWWPHG